MAAPGREARSTSTICRTSRQTLATAYSARATGSPGLEPSAGRSSRPGRSTRGTSDRNRAGELRAAAVCGRDALSRPPLEAVFRKTGPDRRGLKTRASTPLFLLVGRGGEKRGPAARPRAQAQKELSLSSSSSRCHVLEFLVSLVAMIRTSPSPARTRHRRSLGRSYRGRRTARRAIAMWAMGSLVLPLNSEEPMDYSSECHVCAIVEEDGKRKVSCRDVAKEFGVVKVHANICSSASDRTASTPTRGTRPGDI